MDRSIDIQSDLRNICEIEYFINGLFRELKFSRKLYCKIFLVINEAVSNAIVHGNKLNKSKLIRIIFENNTDHFLIIVKDEGDGFDYKTIKDPTHIDNIYNESGRGIFIMKQYADKVIYDDMGRIVKLTFNK
jgi:serine/threonine-protein kinase RsbW